MNTFRKTLITSLTLTALATSAVAVESWNLQE